MIQIPRTVFRLKKAEEVRESITEQTQKKVQQFYKRLKRELAQQIRARGGKDMNSAQLIMLQRDIRNRLQEINQELEQNITDGMRTTANAVREGTLEMLERIGFHSEDLESAFLYIPDNVIQNIVTGQIYQEGWSLSQAIWGHTENFNDKLSQIVAHGSASGKSSYEIAKDLETYVNPTEAKQARTIVSWREATSIDVQMGRASHVGEKIKDSFYPGRVDYNALRLARTMISHAYQQSFETMNRNDPFVIGYRWLTSSFHGRVCDICRGRAENDSYGLGAGVFPKDALPLDHPNGMCTFEVVMSDSMKGIADMIGRWYSSPVGTFPEIDRYANEFLYM